MSCFATTIQLETHVCIHVTPYKAVDTMVEKYNDVYIGPYTGRSELSDMAGT